MKKNLVIFLFIVMIFSLTGCVGTKKENSSALDFKREYESLNGTKDSDGNIYRNVNISAINPYEKVDIAKILEMIKNKDTFYLYVGDSLCPWSRSVIEKSIEVAKNNEIDEIFYLDVLDEKGKENFRDKYEIRNGKVTKIKAATEEYLKLVKIFNDVLDDYYLINSSNEKVSVEEKRINTPSYFYIKNGKVIRMVTGVSNSQVNPNDELTDSILEDEEDLFNELFLEVCDESC